MHFTEFYAIAENNVGTPNPISARKLDQLAESCEIGDCLRVLDIGCGKGWLLRSCASRWAIEGTGLELNPWFHAHACATAQAAGIADVM